ncbi:MAG: ABC transporter permease [Bacteroidetes bacterium]|nr:ABC transporter permease [Bacteroidota bacterium]
MSRNKIFLVAKNEFLKRVKTRWFVVTTLLGPIMLVGFFTVFGIVIASSIDGGPKTISVIDHTGQIASQLEDPDGKLSFDISGSSEEELKQKVLNEDITGYLVLPPGLISGNEAARYYSTEGGGLNVFSSNLTRLVQDVVRVSRLEEQAVSREVYDIITADVSVESIKLSEDGEEQGSSAAYAILGAIMGFLIYITMLVYGSVVMQGVIEEKTSRVVEIIISSVKPFQLLMGKVLGIGAMGLVQMTFWAGLLAAGTMFSGAILSMFVTPGDLDLPTTASQADVLAASGFVIPQVGPEVFVWFVLYFLMGYLLYATLFAGIGSAVEQQQDAQSLMLPVMMPIIISIMFLQAVLEAPNSTLSVVLSLFPFTAPIPMVVRIAMIDVPFWQIALSFSLLVGAFFGAIWVSSRIYRIGILSYGKKPTLKELIRWLKYV